jgi:hypothetical protein
MRNLTLIFNCFADPFLSNCFSINLQQNPLLWSIDTYMTGASSICLFMAAMEESIPFLLDILLPSSFEKLQLLSPGWMVRTFGQSLQSIGVACLLWFWMVPLSWKSLPLGLEDWYLFTPFLAGVAVIVFLCQIGQGRHLGNVVFVLGLFLAVGSVVMDRPLCQLLGTTFLDVFTAANGIFLACDLCFLGLYIRLVNASIIDNIMAPRSRKKAR